MARGDERRAGDVDGRARALGEKIRAARKELKMTQAELAGTDFTKSFISQVEKGFARPSIRSLQIIAGRLNKPIAFFLDDEEPGPPPGTMSKGEHLLQTARSFTRDGHFQDALTAYQEVLASVPKTDHGTRARAYAEMGRVLWSLDRKLEAVEALEEAVDAFRHAQDPLRRVQVLDRLSGYVAELGDQDRAVSLAEQALTIFEEHQLDHRPLELKLRVDAGLLLALLGQHARARKHLEDAMKLASELKDYYRWGEICHAMSFLSAVAGDLQKARDYSLRAVSFYQAVEDRERMVQARVNAASAHHRAGEREEAWRQAAQAEGEAQSLGRPDLLADVYRLQGELAQQEERWEEAVQAYDRAISLRNDAEALIPLHRHRAHCLHRLGRLEEAAASARRAVALLEKQSNASREQLARAYSELARILQDAGALEEAQEVSLKSLELFR